MYLLLALIAYVSLVHILRFRRLRGLHKKYNYTTRQSMSRMTDDEAWEIQKALLQLEFPTTAFKSIQFALFKVHNPIPSCGHTNAIDLRNPIDINPPRQNRPILQLFHRIQTLFRYKRFDRRVHSIQTLIRPSTHGNRSHEPTSQRVSGIGQDPRR